MLKLPSLGELVQSMAVRIYLYVLLRAASGHAARV